MRGTTAAIVVWSCWAAGSLAHAAQPLRIEAGKSVSLKPGESAQTGDGLLRIVFDGVIADSRCPRGEQCVWAGDATVRITLQRNAGAREVRELHTTPRGADAMPPAAAPVVRLVRLDPVPTAGKPVAAGDYVATLALHRGTTAAPER